MVHTASIRRLCVTHYSESQVERWAGFLTPEHYAAAIGDPLRVFVVAERDGRIVGFGQLHRGGAEVEAIYVDPPEARRGVGTALMRHVERAARDASLRTLRLTASLNAVPFYESQGFRVTGYGEYAHPSGARLRCATMVRRLPSPRRRATRSERTRAGRKA